MVRTLETCSDERDEKVVRDVAQHGWHVINILEQNGCPSWSFSIGLFHTYGHPEVLIFGLGNELEHNVINGLGEE